MILTHVGASFNGQQTQNNHCIRNPKRLQVARFCSIKHTHPTAWEHAWQWQDLSQGITLHGSNR